MSALRAFATAVPTFRPEDSINRVAECLLNPEYRNALSVAVIDGVGRPVGMISRHQLNDIFMKKFGRDLFGQRPVADFMRKDVLAVEVDSSLSAAATSITANMCFPLSEDFVITENGRYLGMGAVLHLLGAMEQQITRNAAELERAYRKLSTSQAALVQSEKMAALGQMVAGVAHEINTPLGYVNNNIEMVREFTGQMQLMLQVHDQLTGLLVDPAATDEDIAECLAAIDDIKADIDLPTLCADLDQLYTDTFYGVTQISELVTGLKNFSRLDQAPTDNVSLNDCVENALLIARNALKYGVEVIKRMETLPPVRCTASQINQVLLNLFTNAAQAMPKGGHLLIRTWSDEAWAYVSVQDTGCGIPAENLKRIFDPFFTTKPVGEGTGLGLSITYQIIQQHQGKIRVASEIGKGTRFVISLPRQTAAVIPMSAVA